MILLMEGKLKNIIFDSFLAISFQNHYANMENENCVNYINVKAVNYINKYIDRKSSVFFTPTPR